MSDTRTVRVRDRSSGATWTDPQFASQDRDAVVEEARALQVTPVESEAEGMSEFKPGDRVRVVLDDVQVQAPVEDGYLTVNVGCDEIRFGLEEAGVIVDHKLPEIQPGDVLTDGQGGVWFAQRYFADFDDPKDWKGCNDAGWRTVLVPLNGGPYGDGSGMRPEEANERYAPFTVVHHEDEREIPS